MKFIGSALVLAFFLTSRGTPQTAKTPYPAMAPLSQYLMPPVPVPVLAFVLFFALLFGSWFAFSKLPSGWSQDGSRNSAQVTNKSKKVSSMITYREPMINYYVRDPERIAAFYQENFGFVERFRTPETGPAIHIEVALGTFAVGLARIDAARSMHHLDLDPGKPLHLMTRVNGELRQEDTTDRLTWGFAWLINYISTFTTLRPGDLIWTGTPTGAGGHHTPPKWLKPGDVVEVEVPEIGVLRNKVADEA